MSESWVNAANIVLGAACLGLEAGAYAGLLPARVGVLPVFALFSVGQYGVAWWMKRSPSILNMPDQAAYDGLSNEQQRRGIDCTLPFFYGSATLWMGVGLVSVLIPKTSVLVGALVITGVVEGTMAIHFLLLRAPRKVRALRDASQDQSR
ncbi:hypothetical protein [Salinibacter sp.]|uniref:hypothetical protein n=1 Tax=Salinibacter sp. TaxID=2065818 RepID=UPI0021E7B7B6|nr:hypothetical protein [Salinibacter sp.]